MVPFIGNDDFSGGLNVRELGHRIAPNEAVALEGANIHFSSLKTLTGDTRRLIDATTYPEVPNTVGVGVYPGSGGGVTQPILGHWRYYHGDGKTNTNNSWVRCWGINEYWDVATGLWTDFLGPAGWTLHTDAGGDLDYKPWAVQFNQPEYEDECGDLVPARDGLYIFHGNLAVNSYGKYIWSDGAGNYNTGDIPVTIGLANLRPTIAVPYKNRLFGCDQFREPFTLRWSDVNDPEMWDPAGGGGFLELMGSKADPIVSLHVHKDRLYILCRAAVWRYWLDYYGNEYIEQVHGAAGCIAPQSVCTYKDAFYYVSDEGMIAIYGTDSDCITHKIGPDLSPDPAYLWAIHAVVLARDGSIYVTYLDDITYPALLDEHGDPAVDACGDPLYQDIPLYNTTVWAGDVRRPNIIRPRWVKWLYYRLTNFCMPPQANAFMGNDTQKLRFDAQQPDINEWNPTAVAPTSLPSNSSDPAYPHPQDGGPRHYSYRVGAGWDRDQIPAYNDACEDQLYAGDDGCGYKLLYRSPRYIPRGNMRDSWFHNVKLDYYIYKDPPAHLGVNAAWSRIWIDRVLLPLTSTTFPLEVTWWPIRDNTLDAGIGGAAWQAYRLTNLSPSNGNSISMEFNVVGQADRTVTSWGIEFRFFGIEYEVGPDKYNPED